MDTAGPDGALGPLRAAWPVAAVGLAWTVSIAAAVGSWVLLGPVREVLGEPGAVLPTDLVGPLAAVALAGLGGLVVLRSAARRYGWLLLALGVAMTVVQFTAEYGVYALERPASGLPLGTVAGWVQDLWMATWVLAFLLLPALFPDGTAASAAWRRRVQLAGAVWVGLIVVFVLAQRPLSNWFLEVNDPPANPTGVLAVPETAINVVWVVVTLASAVIGMGSLVARWRAAGAELRQQIKWVLYAFGLALAVLAADVANQALQGALGVDLGLRWPLAVLSAATMLGLVVSLGFAVLKLRLYDVDLVINRTLVYGALTVSIVVAYVAVVAGIGALLPVGELPLSLLATGIVAVAVAPLRLRLQRWANHLMFGQRDDPYAVLSELGRLLARSGSPDATLQTVAETVSRALKLPGAAIELQQDGSWRTRACSGARADAGDDGIVVALRHQGKVVGRLVVTPRSPHEPLSPQDHRLLADVAPQAGALAHTVGLMTALQRSREHLVLAREEERRRIRRDLHDGLGPSLASQTFRLDAALAQVDQDPGAAAEVLSALKQHNQELVADIRRLVYELRPPALDELGLAGALAAHAGQLDRPGGLAVDVATEPDPLPSLPAAVEVAAYRIAREAITNVARHAHATRCTASLELADAALSIVITDDGLGIPEAARPGVGLTSMRERAEELGGTVELAAGQPTGVTVNATLPLAAPAHGPSDHAPSHGPSDDDGVSPGPSGGELATPPPTG